jgi:3'-phosphoadenosine 5'-phosphosulfate (PAPS) 3'-phosphatase
MVLNSKNLITLTNLAIEAALEAGKIIDRSINKPIDVQQKDGGYSFASQVVTEVDFESETAILNILKSTTRDFDIGILTEESIDNSSRFEKDFFWCIDPIDGTLSFIERISGYAVSIALVTKAGEPIIGVVYDPDTKTLYHAIKGIGAFQNNRKIELPVNKNDEFTLCLDRSLLSDTKYQKIVELFEDYSIEIGINKMKIENSAGAVINAIYLIKRNPACYFKFPRNNNSDGCLWDFAATACIIQELGMIVSDFKGNKLDLNYTNSTFINDNGVLYASNSQLSNFIKNLHFKLLKHEH